MAGNLFIYPTPWGGIRGEWSALGLRTLLLPAPGAPAAPPLAAPPAEIAAALDRFFAGEPEAFQGLPLDFGNASEFTVAVWQCAREIPWGQTATYGELAARVGGSAAHARAVGRALGANPLHIIVPCHRFIAQDGKLVNFAAGLEWKRRLLQLEGSLMF